MSGSVIQSVHTPFSSSSSRGGTGGAAAIRDPPPTGQETRATLPRIRRTSDNGPREGDERRGGTGKGGPAAAISHGGVPNAGSLPIDALVLLTLNPMRTEQRVWTVAGWRQVGSGRLGSDAAAHLVLVFGAPAALSQPGLLAELQQRHPSALLFGCSTAGEIHGTEVADDSVVATAVHFAATRLHSARVALAECADNSFQAGECLAAALPLELPGLAGAPAEPLRHVFVLSDGLRVNGSDLVRGLTSCLPAAVTLTGGLAGDGARFGTTLVVHAGRAESGTVAALGFYGSALRIGFGSLGGWDPFGPERLITRSQGNVLYEFDGQSALGLYKQYLGAHADQLPASGLLFPLSLRTKAGEVPVVRTILAVDEATQSLTFAGDIPQGAYARLMKANFDRLIDGATDAARTSHGAIDGTTAELAILISCVGRKLLLKQRIEEEVEGVREVLGATATLAGFYSYGEISPFKPGARCELHNQTMTITTLAEV